MKFLEKPKGRMICVIIIILTAFLSSLLTYFIRTSFYNSFVSTEGTVTEIEWFKSSTGTVTEARIHKRHNGSRYTHRFYYSFTVDDISYTGSELSKEKGCIYDVGDTLEVWYDPNNPENSRPYKPSADLEVLVPYCIAAPLIVGTVFGRKKNGRALYS